jgi:serine protease
MGFAPQSGVRFNEPSDALGNHTDRMVLRYKPGAELAFVPPQIQTTRLAAQWGLKLEPVREMADGAQVVSLGAWLPLETVEQLARALQSQDPQLETAEPDAFARPSWVPNDTLLGQQWALARSPTGVNAFDAWDKSRGNGVTVAVLDTGHTLHSDLVPNLLPGYDMISSTIISGDGDGRDADALDVGDFVAAGQCGSNTPARNSTWHGTHVAAIVGSVANNGKGVAGVAPLAKVLPVRVLGKCGGYLSDISDGITWAAGGSIAGVPVNPNPARVINLSLGGASSCPRYAQSAVDFALSKGAVVLVAAGNGNVLASTQAPANCKGVMAVGASTIRGAKAQYSNHGPTVAISAPGGDSDGSVLSALNTGAQGPAAETYAAYMGTSMATPAVSGIAALMLAANRTLSAQQVIDLLKQSAKPFVVPCAPGCGAGIADARRAVDLALASPGAPPTPPPPPPPPPPVPSATFAEKEPNDTLAQGQHLNALNATVNGAVQAKSDLDFYWVRLPHNGKLSVTLRPTDKASGFGLALFMANGGSIISVPGIVGISPNVRLTNLTGQTQDIYFRASRSTGAIGAYTLTAVQ